MQTQSLRRYTEPRLRNGKWYHTHQIGCFGVSERSGSAASLCKLSLVTEQEAIGFLFERALDYKRAGYKVTWWDQNRWFEASCAGQPTAFVVLTEVTK